MNLPPIEPPHPAHRALDTCDTTTLVEAFVANQADAGRPSRAPGRA
jgi:hypothetical protein